MNNLKVIKTGVLDVIKNIKFVLFLYILNIFFSLIIALPFKSLLEKAFAASKISEKLLNEFNFTVFIDFIINYGKEFSSIMSNFLPIAFFYFFFNLFLTGGILSIFKTDNRKFDFKSFFPDCTKYFPRMIKQFLINFIFSLILILIFAAFIIITIAIHDGNQPTFFSMLPIIILACILLGLFLLVMDFGKVIIVEEDSRKIFITVLNSIKFVVKNILGILSFILPLLFLFILGIIGYLYISNIVIINSVWIIIFVFFIQQIFIILRVAFRIVFYSCYYSFYKMKLK
jgi:hypothetical protein